MSSPAGWYPDPGGQSGRFRFWDGRTWSAELTGDPRTRPPGAATSTDPAARETIEIGARRPVRSRVWLTGLIAGLVVLVVVVGLVVRSVGGGLEVGDPGPPQSTSTRELCPLPAVAGPSAALGGDRVVSGSLSYPRLGAPFNAPNDDNRVPYGREIRSQEATVEARPDGTLLWVAQILIARLTAGDGFFAVQDGATIIADCVTGLFYGNVAVQRTDLRNEAITLSGRDGWLIEAHLTFDVPDIKTTGETMIIIVVETDDGAGLFYGSLPDTSPQYNTMIRAALSELRVS